MKQKYKKTKVAQPVQIAEPIVDEVVAEEPKSLWWYFADDNYLGLKVVTILIVFMFGLWYFHTFLSVGVPGYP